MQSALHLLGFIVDFAYEAYPHQRPLVLTAIARLIRILRIAIIDTNPFDMRLAAVKCMFAIQSIWAASTTSKSTGPILLGFSLILLDLLNDDDDEIRQLAASATANLFRARSNKSIQETVPLLSTHRLAVFLSKAFSGSPSLIREAIRRLTDTAPPTPVFGTSFARRFAAARQVDTALFATEKQNLYRDETLDAVFWSRILSQHHARAIPQPLRSGLANWVLSGLDVLTSTAETEIDGPLGWTSKDEVFALGMRLFCAAEVVLAWDGQEQGVWGMQTPSKPSTGGGDGSSKASSGAKSVRSRILTALRCLVDLGHAAEVHPLWLERIELVLEKHVVRTLKMVKGRLHALGMSH